MIDKLNLDKLIRIKVYPEQKETDYVYKKRIRFLGIILQAEGFYDQRLHYPINLGDFPNHFVRDKVLYEKPELRLYFQDDHIISFFFDTYEAAKMAAAPYKYMAKSWLDYKTDDIT
jgi:hypothetical protein